MWKSIYRRHLRNQISLLKKIRTKQTSRISNRTVTLTKVSFSTIMANDQDISKYFEFAKNLTLEAGKLIKNVDDTEKVVETKWIEKDLVTNFDHKIEEFLINALNKEFPDHKFIGEETIGLSILPELTDSPTWLIDPIDELKKSLLAFEVGSLRMYKNRDIALGRFLALFEASQAIRNVGSAALSMAYVAKGVIDCFQMDGLQPWDVAAGMIIVSEAGGTLLDSKGGPFNLMKPNTVVASTTQLACEMTKLIVDTDLKTQRKRLRRT
ncbi:inositol monophosphatase 2-like isoform X3 [Vespa mandarinia]|uniref:inositol monophosphatase 2-like isoform X3 n=1 Tax=Vespa mandarinia TaxID=7446 RepID=UPI00161E58A9|nr:inositol monophosphatase 2-like isoform X3 [Vespa mandarinia]